MSAAVENVLTVAGVAAVGIVVVLVCSCVLSICGLLGGFSRCARTRDVLDLTSLPRPPFLPWLPEPLWRLQRPLLARFFVWLTVGLYDQEVRDLLGFTWTTRDERLHRLFGRAVAAAFTLVPPRYRKHPRARDGLDRAAGRVPAGAPLLESPARNLPAGRFADGPQHYNPADAPRTAWAPGFARRMLQRWHHPHPHGKALR